MAFAINIKASNASTRPILDLWDEVGRLEDAPSMPALGYPPHITFAIYDEGDEAAVTGALATVFAAMPAIRLNFAAVRFFDNAPMVLWAAPSANPALLEAHAAVHRLFDPQGCRPHYRPGNWVPHCTLGTRIAADRREAALALTRREIEPFEVVFDIADAVRFLPVTVIAERKLG